MSIRIALDAMGGDHGPEVVVPAALDVIAQFTAMANGQDSGALEALPKGSARTSGIHLILVGNQERIEECLRAHPHPPAVQATIVVRHASQIVTMDESPSNALRMKKDSSMRVAINLVKNNEADACVSAGNTGALMATARYVLKTLPGIDRPAICTAIPSLQGHTHMLDLGANVDSTALHLFEFAIMGSELTSAVDNQPAPKIGLLNVGEEEIKGNERVKEAHRLLLNSHLNYIGYVEGNDIYEGTADVVVCDGFVGNVALKTSEGLAQMLRARIKQSFTRNWYTRFAALVSQPVLNDIRNNFDPRRYNGASLLGLRGIVIKSHGGADRLAFAHAIQEAVLEVEKNVPQRIHNRLAEWLAAQETPHAAHGG